jgi:antitoxin VapB
MALDKNHGVAEFSDEKALEERASGARRERWLAFLENEVWPTIPKDQLGRVLSREEEAEILGYGPS